MRYEEIREGDLLVYVAGTYVGERHLIISVNPHPILDGMLRFTKLRPDGSILITSVGRATLISSITIIHRDGERHHRLKVFRCGEQIFPETPS